MLCIVWFISFYFLLRRFLSWRYYQSWHVIGFAAAGLLMAVLLCQGSRVQKEGPAGDLAQDRLCVARLSEPWGGWTSMRAVSGVKTPFGNSHVQFLFLLFFEALLLSYRSSFLSENCEWIKRIFPHYHRARASWAVGALSRDGQESGKAKPMNLASVKIRSHVLTSLLVISPWQTVYPTTDRGREFP